VVITSIFLNYKHNTGTQEAQVTLRNPREAFRGQSRSPNMVPFDMLRMVCHYCATVTFWDFRPVSIQ